jgi:hypothetical protein
MVHASRATRRWGAYAALGVALGLVLSGPIGGDAGAAPAQPIAQQSPQNNAKPSPPPTVESVPERVAAALEAHNSYEKSPQAKDDARDSAQAAKDAAYWAKWLGVAGAVETAVTAVGVVLVGLTLKAARQSAKEAKRAADAMGQSVKVSERALIEMERPYVFVRFGKSGFDLSSRAEKRPDGGVNIIFTSRYSGTLEVKFVNVGRSPALLTHLREVYEIVLGTTAMPTPLDPKTERGETLPVGTYAIQGDPYSISRNSEWAFGHKPMPWGEVFNNRFFCMGLLHYEDVLGGKYILGYCGYFSRWAETFVLEGGDEYNFLRVEADARAGSRPSWMKAG